MRLLLAIKSLNVVGGGAERVLVDLANGMTARGHHVEVLTFDAPGESFYPLDPRVDRRDLGIGEPGQPTPRWRFLKSIPSIRRAVRESSSDLVVAFMHSTYVPLAFALVGTGARLIASEHASAAHFAARRWQAALAWVASGIAIARTEPATTPKMTRLSNRTFLIPNAVDVETFGKVALTQPADAPVMACVGRFMEQKNHLELIRAFALVAAKFPNWSLRLVGDGPLKPMLEEEVKKLSLGDRVLFIGTSSDVAAEYQKASFVVVSSHYESFGLVAAESMASGRPVLAFRECIGIKDIVHNNVNGLLVDGTRGRVPALADGMARLMSDRALRETLGREGPRTVQGFHKEAVLSCWEEMFQQLSTARTAS